MAEERKHLMRPSAADSRVATGIADPRDRNKKSEPLSVRRDAGSHEFDPVDSLVGTVDTMATGADAFDVFEFPIDTDVKGDVLTKTGFMSESNSSSTKDGKFPVIKRKPDHDSVDGTVDNNVEANDAQALKETQAMFQRLSAKGDVAGSNDDSGHSGVEPPRRTAIGTERGDSLAWPSKPNLSRHSGAGNSNTATPEDNARISADDSFRQRSESVAKPGLTEGRNEPAAGKFGIEARTFNNNVWGRRSRDSSGSSDVQSPSKSSTAGHYRRDRNAKSGIQSGANGRVFGTRTEARRERKERGLAAAASSLLTPGDEDSLGSSMSLLNDLIAKYSVVGVDDHRLRNDTYRRLPGGLPRFWSSKLVDCQLDDGRPHRVMFLWNDKGGELYIFDSATRAISGPELRATYRNWELDPVEFARFVSSNRTYPDKVTTQSKSWPFSRSKRT